MLTLLRRMRRPRLTLHLLQLVSLIPSCVSLVNITVDDALPDTDSGTSLKYSSAWNFGPACPGCQAQPDPAQAHMGTWHDATFDPTVPGNSVPQNMTFAFTGASLSSSQSSSEPVAERVVTPQARRCMSTAFSPTLQ